MRTRALSTVLIAALSVFFLSGCGFMKKQSRRTITFTHWGNTDGATLAENQPTQPQAQPTPEAGEEVAEAENAEAAKDAKDAKEGGEAVVQEGITAEGETAEDAGSETASTANIGGANTTAQMNNAEKNMTLYIAYQEAVSSKNLLTGDQSGPVMKSRVRICKLQDDNSLQCDESKELNQMLNPHLRQR